MCLAALLDLAQDAVQIVADPIHWDSKHMIPPLTEELIALGIVLLLRLVDQPVDLDNEPSLSAQEIDDVRTDRLLTPKPPAPEAATAQHGPELSFRWCRASA